MTVLTWKTVNQKFGNKCDGHLGRVLAFSVFYNSLRSKDDVKTPYAIAVLLPGFDSTRYYAESVKEAQDKAEKMCNDWIVAAGLKVGGDS